MGRRRAPASVMDHRDQGRSAGVGEDLFFESPRTTRVPVAPGARAVVNAPAAIPATSVITFVSG